MKLFRKEKKIQEENWNLSIERDEYEKRICS